MKNELALLHDQKTPEQMRGAIMALEDAMRAEPDLQVELKTEHKFAPGVYMRILHIPAGVTLTGLIHKTEHLNVLSQGRIQVYTDDGMKELTASTVILSKPGIKRVGHAIEDSVWITVHPNPGNEKNVKKLEDILVTNRFEDVQLGVEKPKALEKGE